MKINPEEEFFKGQYETLKTEIKFSHFKPSYELTTNAVTNFFYLVKSLERSGSIEKASEYLSLFEKKIKNSDNNNGNLSYLILIILKISLLIRKGKSKESLLYLPIFGEFLEDTITHPDSERKCKFCVWYYYSFGEVFQSIGMYSKAFSFFQKGIAIVNNNENDLGLLSELYNKLGEIFLLKGEAVHANENFMIALHYSEQINNNYNKFQILINLINLNFYLENFDEVENLFRTILTIQDLITDSKTYCCLYFSYLRYKIFSTKTLDINLDIEYNSFLSKMQKLQTIDNLLTNLVIKLGESIYLNRKNSIESILKSKYILQGIIPKLKKINYNFAQIAMIEMCDVYLKEIKFLRHIDSFFLFQKISNDLLENAKRQHLYPVLIEVFLLHSKMELLFDEKNNLISAEKYLALAEIIAEEKNLKHLSSKILQEEKNFKDQIDRWISLLPSKNTILNVESLENNKRFAELKHLLLIQKPTT